MKKEAILYTVIGLVVGILVVVIYTNATKNTPAPGTSAPASAPAVNHQQQIKMLQDVLAKEPNNRNAWVQLGHSYFDSDQPMLAIDAYDKALAINDQDPNVLTDQGVMFRRLGWFDRAVENFEKANRVNSNHQQSLYNLGIVYLYDLQDIPKAVDAWERFLVVNPGGPGSSQVRAELENLKKHPSMQK